MLLNSGLLKSMVVTLHKKGGFHVNEGNLYVLQSYKVIFEEHSLKNQYTNFLILLRINLVLDTSSSSSALSVLNVWAL